MENKVSKGLAEFFEMKNQTVNAIRCGTILYFQKVAIRALHTAAVITESSVAKQELLKSGNSLVLILLNS